MVAPAPSVKTVSDIKRFLMQPALTSHYECHFTIPDKTRGFIFQSVTATDIDTLLTLSCSDASLPGSTLATHELNNDVTGVTQRNAYRRLYDDRADFTFYVNQDYTQIRLFEAWMRFISGEQENIETAGKLYRPYRVEYPTNYKTTIYITKFERDIGKPGKAPNTSPSSGESKKMVYTFFNAFPISVGSMPVSYESSQLLKVTVSFTYDRYVAGNTSVNSSGASSQPAQTTPPGTPNPSTNYNPTGTITPETQAAANAAYAGNLNLGNYSPGTLTNTDFFNDDPRVVQTSTLVQENFGDFVIF